MQLRDAMDVANEILLREIAPSFSKITLIIRTGEERSIGKSFHIPLLDLNAAVLDEERILPLPLTIRESEDKKLNKFVGESAFIVVFRITGSKNRLTSSIPSKD